MGVKGLQSFVDQCCPEACVTVHLRQVARNHSAKIQRDSTSTATGPTLVVDGMACLRHWYSCEDWVCGGQWREYVDLLKRWVEAFTSAGIRLVFFFDGVVEEKKRSVWVKRRRRVNGDIAKIFRYIKKYGEQPSGQLFCLPSGLATFTPFALRSLKQEVFCTVQEADYEIARYASQNNCIGILGQDSDFLIHDSAPYFSLDKLQMKSLTTVMYDRHKLCQNIGLTFTQLPLLACLLGNDVVSEDKMQHVRNNATETYRKSNPVPHSCAPQGQVVYAVSQLVSRLCSQEEGTGLVPQSLGLSAHQRDLLKRGICSYYLSEQRLFELGGLTTVPPAFEKHVSPEILKACQEKHVAAEGFMLYSVVCVGSTECSNTLEDEEDGEMLPQALVYKPCRQRIYGLLLLLGQDNKTVNTHGQSVDCPTIKEWFVFPGNPLKEPEMVHPIPVSLPCDQPSLDLLWFGSGPEISALRLTALLSIFDCMELFELYGVIEDSLLASVCLVTYVILQVQTLSQEDADAYLSQAVCLRLKTSQELQQIELPFLSSAAVQLGSLYVRGLSHMLGANSASGCPLPSVALMPWHCFDGRLFHSKYLLAHSGTGKPELLVDSDPSCLSVFLQLREKLTEVCMNRGRVLQSRPKVLLPRFNAMPVNVRRSRHTGCPPAGGEGWMERGRTARGHRHGRGCMERGEERIHWRDYGSGERRRECGGHRGGHRGAGGQQFYSFSPEWQDGGPQNTNCPQKQSRGRPYSNRGRYQLASRWSHPPAPGTTQRETERSGDLD